MSTYTHCLDVPRRLGVGVKGAHPPGVDSSSSSAFSSSLRAFSSASAA